MFKIIDVFHVGEKLSITVEGNCSEIKTGSKLTDTKGNTYIVDSVGMTRFEDPKDISNVTTLLVTPVLVEKGSELFIA